MKGTTLLCVFLCFAVASTFAFISSTDEKLIAELVEEYNIKTVDLSDLDASTALFKQFYANFQERKQSVKAVVNNKRASDSYCYQSNIKDGFCSWATDADKTACCYSSTAERNGEMVDSWFDYSSVSNQCLTKVLEISCAECEHQVQNNSYVDDSNNFLGFPVIPCATYCNEFYTACQSQLVRNGTKFITAGSADEFCAKYNGTTNCYAGGSNPKWGGGLCPYESSALGGMPPAKPATQDSICGFETSCCDADELSTLTFSLGLVVDTSSKCYNELVNSACATCDPNAGYWTSPITGTSKTCQSTCQRYIKSCSGVRNGSNNQLLIPANATCNGLSTSTDSKVCYAGAPIPNKNSAASLAVSVGVVLLSVFVVLF